MKKIYSLMSLLLVMASVSHGGSQTPEEDNQRWDHFGSPANKGIDGVGNSPVDPASAVPPVLGAAVVGGLPAPVPLPAPGVAGSGDETNTVGAALLPAVSVRVPTLEGNMDENPWGDALAFFGSLLVFGAEPAQAAQAIPLPVQAEADAAPAPAPGGVAAHMVAPVLPPVVPAHLDEYFHSVPAGPAGPAGDMQINDLDAYAAEGIRLATLWANAERDGRSLFPSYRQGIHDGLVLTEPLLRGLGLSRILVDWTVSNVKLNIMVEKMSVTNPTAVFTMGMNWLEGCVPEQICGFTLTPLDSTFRISCIGAPQPKTVNDLVLEVTTLTHPNDILGAGRNLLVASFGVPGENNPVLKAMGLEGEEALINHQSKVKRRIDWIRHFLDASRPDAVAGHLGVGSLLVAICRQLEGTDRQVPQVYGFNALEGINMANVTYKLADKAPDEALQAGRVGAYRLLIGPEGLLRLQPQEGVGTRVLIPLQAIPEPVVAQPVQALPAQDDFWNWSLSELFSRTWASFFAWPDFSFLWNWNFGYAAVQPETAEALSQRILEAFDIMSMGRHVLWWARHQMVAAEREQAEIAREQAETEENRRAQAAADAAANLAAEKDEDAGMRWT